MDARAVLDLWRRVLAEQDLQEAVLAEDAEQRLSKFSLTPDELHIARAFSAERRAAYWPCEGYRYRLITGVLDTVMSVGAPLTLAILGAHERDLLTLSRDFISALEWRDRGLYLYRECRDFLVFLGRAPSIVEIPGVADVLALETAICELMIRLSGIAAEEWQRPPSPWLLRDEQRYQRTPAAVVITVEHDIAPWLVEPDRAHEIAVARKRQHLLSYVPSAEAMPEYAVISESAHRLFDALDEPRSLDEASAFFGSSPRARDKARSTMTRFLHLGIIRPQGQQAAASEQGPAYGEHWEEVAAARGAKGTIAHDALIDTLVERCRPLEGRAVLDIACGQGDSTIALAHGGARVHGIDISQRSIADAQDRRARLPAEIAERVRFSVMDATALPIADASLDVITCLQAIWCLPDRQRACKEFYRVLRPGGRLAIQLWGADERCSLLSLGAEILYRVAPALPRPKGVYDDARLTPASLPSLVRRAGFVLAPVPVTTHSLTLEMRSAEEFWQAFGAVADTANYVRQSLDPARQAALLEQWNTDTRRLRDDLGVLTVTLEWLFYVAHKPDSAV